MPGKIVLLDGRAVILPEEDEELVKSELYLQWKAQRSSEKKLKGPARKSPKVQRKSPKVQQGVEHANT